MAETCVPIHILLLIYHHLLIPISLYSDENEFSSYTDNYGRKINFKTGDFKLADGQTGNLYKLEEDDSFMEKLSKFLYPEEYASVSKAAAAATAAVSSKAAAVASATSSAAAAIKSAASAAATAAVSASASVKAETEKSGGAVVKGSVVGAVLGGIMGLAMIL